MIFLKKFLASLLFGAVFAGVLAYREPVFNLMIAIAMGISAMAILYGVAFLIVCLRPKFDNQEHRKAFLHAETDNIPEYSGFPLKTYSRIELDEYGRAKFDDPGPTQHSLD